jgi:hypothetical protein
MRRILVTLVFTALQAALAAAIAGGATPPPNSVVAQAKRAWLKEVRASASSGDRSKNFPSPSRAVLMHRLHQAQARYGFKIVSVTMLHPLQRAPVIVIRSDRKHAIAKATPAIINAFDPRHVTKSNPSGYAYEAYFFEARDKHGIAYLATFNHWRPPHVGGGQWAAEESLYPFDHG